MSHSGEGVGSPDVFAPLDGGKDEIGAASIKRSNYARVGKDILVLRPTNILSYLVLGVISLFLLCVIHTMMSLQVNM